MCANKRNSIQSKLTDIHHVWHASFVLAYWNNEELLFAIEAVWNIPFINYYVECLNYGKIR